MRGRFFVTIFALLTLAWLVPTASACPLCKEAIAVSDDEDDVNNWPRAMNQSIYLMLAVPYSTLAILGFFVYRGLRQNEAYLAKLRPEEAPTIAPPQPAP